MKLDRGEVEYRLEMATQHGDAVEAELCRSYLAVLDAPEGRVVSGYGYFEIRPSGGDSYIGIERLDDQVVRLVRVGDGDACIGGGEG